jgi:hypothetical protein
MAGRLPLPGLDRARRGAHLPLSGRTTLLVALKGAIRARGDFDRMEADLARERAGRYGPAALVEQLRETAGSSSATCSWWPRAGRRAWRP